MAYKRSALKPSAAKTRQNYTKSNKARVRVRYRVHQGEGEGTGEAYGRAYATVNNVS